MHTGFLRARMRCLGDCLTGRGRSGSLLCDCYKVGVMKGKLVLKFPQPSPHSRDTGKLRAEWICLTLVGLIIECSNSFICMWSLCAVYYVPIIH